MGQEGGGMCKLCTSACIGTLSAADVCRRKGGDRQRNIPIERSAALDKMALVF